MHDGSGRPIFYLNMKSKTFSSKLRDGFLWSAGFLEPTDWDGGGCAAGGCIGSAGGTFCVAGPVVGAILLILARSAWFAVLFAFGGGALAASGRPPVGDGCDT